MDDNTRNLQTIAILMALEKVQEDNALIAIEHTDSKLVFKNKLGKSSEFEIPKGKDGIDGKDGVDGKNGKDGKSIKGEQGLPGKDGISIKGDPGLPGKDGISIKGDKGDKGDKGKDADITKINPHLEHYFNDKGHLIIEMFNKKYDLGAFEYSFDQRGHLIVKMFGKSFDLGTLKGKSGGGSGGGAIKFPPYNNSAPMTEAVGGYPEGTTFENITYAEMWTGLLYGAQRPIFSTFNINLSASIYETGDTIAEGVYQATWTINSPQFLDPNTIRIDYIHNSTITNIANNLPNIIPTNIDIPAITFNTPTTISFKITGASTLQGEFYRSLYVSFYDRIYVGESNSSTLDSNAIKALRITRLSDNINGDYQTEAGGYKWFCFPVSMGQRLNFIDDATDLEVSMDDYKVVNVTNSFGVIQSYYAYRSYYILNAALKIRVF